MQGIHAWARANPQRVTEMLRQNPSFVFFREVPAGDIPPELGAQGSLGQGLGRRFGSGSPTRRGAAGTEEEGDDREPDPPYGARGRHVPQCGDITKRLQDLR